MPQGTWIYDKISAAAPSGGDQAFWRVFDCHDTHPRANAGPVLNVQETGPGISITGILRKVITADLTVVVKVGPGTLGTITIPASTAVDIEVSVSITTKTLVKGQAIIFDITASDSSKDIDGVATFTIKWGMVTQVTVSSTNMGTYDPAAHYAKGVTVQLNGSTYLSLQDSNTGHPVTDPAWWTPVAVKGDTGAAGTGTVTSVALTVPAEFSVAGSPVTTSGTLAVSKATQSANLVYAGPTTGSAAAPAFRAVVPADLPLASSSAFGAVKVDGTTITASSGVISAVGAGSSGVIGTANFNGNGSISNAYYAGVITSVTFVSTGKYTVNLSGTIADFSIALMASDDLANATTAFVTGTPNIHAGVSSFQFITYSSQLNALRNSQSITVALLKL